MRHLRLLALLCASAACGGCFQMTTIVQLNGDGSGTIEHSMLITKTALAQLRQLSMLGGGRGQTIDFVSEEQAKKMAATLGAGVTYVSSEAVDTPLAEGRNARYAFTDINTLRISQQPEARLLVVLTLLVLRRDPAGVMGYATDHCGGHEWSASSEHGDSSPVTTVRRRSALRR